MRPKIIGFASLLGLIFYIVACSPVNFAVNKSPDDGFTFACAQTSTGCQFDYSVSATNPKVDILIVDDNSASMSFEQKALANRFSGFIQFLDGKHIDYRIAITTTDIHVPGDDNEPRAINQQGALQNGNLISFGDGINYLTPEIPDRVGRFNRTIVRPETLACEQFIADYISGHGAAGIGSPDNALSSLNSSDYQTKYKANCPSGDERGTYAANLAIKNNSAGFMRKDSYLAVIFVSDEDVRSGLYCGGPNNLNCSYTGYPLEEMDQPLSLFKTLKAQGKDKVAEVHAIVVTDNTCLAEQNSQTLGNPPVAATQGLVQGSMGNLYLNFPQNGWGSAVSICMNNYSASLQPIANKVTQNKGEVLACDNPTNLQITSIPANANFSFSRNGRNVIYSTPLSSGSQIHYSYSCSNKL